MPHLLVDTNLRLLQSRLQTLDDTAYFDTRITNYVRALRSIIPHLLSASPPVPNELKHFIARQIWRATEFVAGSAMRLQPYEAIYGLQCATREWLEQEPIIVTALIQEPNFYFQGVHPTFRKLAQEGLGVTDEIVQIRLPEIYRQKPLYSIALYHELGHFIDTRYKLTETVLALNPELSLPGISGAPAEIDPETRFNHMREYFADLFAACYCGRAIKQFLEGIAPDAEASISHPESYHRYQAIEALVSDQVHGVITGFNQALAARRLPTLELRYRPVDVTAAFKAIRPVTINSIEEVHGILGSAWEFLDSAADQAQDPWDRMAPGEVERVVNDLVEKSIRNWMIREKWHATPAS